MQENGVSDGMMSNDERRTCENNEDDLLAILFAEVGMLSTRGRVHGRFAEHGVREKLWGQDKVAP